MIKSAMITECWTPQSSHSFSLYILFPLFFFPEWWIICEYVLQIGEIATGENHTIIIALTPEFLQHNYIIIQEQL